MEIDPLEIIFPVDPKKVVKVIFPKYAALSDGARTLLEKSGEVLSFKGKTGRGLCGALDDLRCGGLLNILTKAGPTPVGDGRTVLDFLKEGDLRELRRDGFFAATGLSCNPPERFPQEGASSASPAAAGRRSTG